MEQRISSGDFETWFESDHGRLMAFVTNGQRALLMVLDERGDAGEHLIDPQAAADVEEGGYVLDNGQHDTYADRDTVALQIALEVLMTIVDGQRHPGAAWHSDRK